MTWPTWGEDEYVAYLTSERRRFAWVMRRYGQLTTEQADAAASAQYPYEPADTPYRGLVFHDESWNWAMQSIHGDDYPLTHPELVWPPPEYDAID